MCNVATLRFFRSNFPLCCDSILIMLWLELDTKIMDKIWKSKYLFWLPWLEMFTVSLRYPVGSRLHVLKCSLELRSLAWVPSCRKHNPSDSCWDISHHKCDSGPRGKVRRSLKSLGFILWGPWTTVETLMAIYPTVVELSWVVQSGPR